MVQEETIDVDHVFDWITRDHKPAIVLPTSLLTEERRDLLTDLCWSLADVTRQDVALLWVRH